MKSLAALIFFLIYAQKFRKRSTDVIYALIFRKYTTVSHEGKYICVQTDKQTNSQALAQKSVHTHTYTHTQSYIHTHTYTPKHPNTHTHICVYTPR